MLEVGKREARYSEVTAIVQARAHAAPRGARLREVKRGSKRAWPKQIVEIPSSRVDPRADPAATQKISREQLEAALTRTKSGTRSATRSEPLVEDLHGEPPFSEPRDDAPIVTIERIDSMEFEAVDPSALPAPSSSRPSSPPPSARSSAPPSSTPSPLAPLDISLVSPAARARSESRSMMHRIRATPRMAFAAGVGLAVLVTLVALLAFFAGRLTGR